MTNHAKEDVAYRIWDESEETFRDGLSEKYGGTSQVVIIDVLTGFLELYVFDNKYHLPEREIGKDKRVLIEIDDSQQVTIEEVF